MTATSPRLARAARLLGCGFGAGLLLTLCLPPIGLWILGPAGVAVLAWTLTQTGGWRARLLVGFASGVGLYGPGLWWATEFQSFGWGALVLVEAFLLAGCVALVRRGYVAVGLPAALVLAEAVRGRWPFGGLPLGGLELGQVEGPLLNVARLGGHLLVVGMVGVAGVALWALSTQQWRLMAVATVIVALFVLLGAAAFDGSRPEPLEVGVAQGGGVRGIRAIESDPRAVLDAHIAASEALQGAGLVVWPENVVDASGPLAGSEEEAIVSNLAAELGTTLVTGVVEDVPGTHRFRNAAVVWIADGTIVDRYEKVHRVPFGEYVPWRGLFGKIADLSNVPRDAFPGHGPGVLRTPLGKVAVTISYEVFFAGRARSGVRAGGRLLLVPTNASSYTTSQVPAQELAAARVRAVETGRWVVQAAPTGYSGIVDQRGNVHTRGPLGTPVTIRTTVQLRSGQTWAMRLGDGPIVLLALAALGAAWIGSEILRGYASSFMMRLPGNHRREDRDGHAIRPVP